MGEDALFPIATPPAGDTIKPLLEDLQWSKAGLARFLGVTRQTVSRWASGHRQMDERQKAALRFLAHAAQVESSGLHGAKRARFLSGFGQWASKLGIRGFVCARFGDPRRFEQERLLHPEEIRTIRDQLGWIQAEMAAFFGVTHSTPAKWEGPDPRVGRSTEAELMALREWFSRSDTENEEARTLWEEGVSEFMTGILGWEKGIFPGH